MALIGTTVCGGLLFYGLFTLSHVIVLRSFDREQPTSSLALGHEA